MICQTVNGEKYHDPLERHLLFYALEATSPYLLDNKREADLEKRRFDRWMKEVSHQFEGLCAMRPEDILDCPYADWYASGMTPIEAAQEAFMEFAGTPFPSDHEEGNDE